MIFEIIYRSMKSKWNLFLYFIFLSTMVVAQKESKNDLFFWNWYQINYKVTKKDYVSFQFQNRLKENMSTFNKNNFYFIAGRNINKKINIEALYQLTTNYTNDNHTFYVGLTYKHKINDLKIHFRSSVQHIRNYFTGNYKIDKPFFEWRNRLRIFYPLSNSFSVSLSTEPYIKFEAIHQPYFSRIRNVAQFSYDLNRYQSVSLFYLYEPEIITFSSPKNDYVLGFTYQLMLPRKWKKMKKVFEFENKYDKQILNETKEYFYQ